MSTQDTITDITDIDALLVQRAWLRRLASALVSNPTAAEDLTQETWLSALTSPPRSTDAPHGWLRRVFLSRLHDSTRARGRREAREECAATVQRARARVETPEEIAARMELHRRLAVHLASIDKRLGEVLFLRFVEDLEPIEVARRLGIPDGTVRWRLKRGLEVLRARLDADTGEGRQGWLPLLIPLAMPANIGGSAKPRAKRQSLESGRAGRLWTGGAMRVATLGALLGMGLLAVCSRCSLSESGNPERAASRLYKSGDLDRAARQLTAQIPLPPSAAPSATAPAPPPPSCPEAQALEKERDELAAAAEPIRNQPKEIFQASSSNTAIEKRFGPDADAMLARVGKCGHTLECRGVVCRIALVAPEALYQGRGPGIGVCFDRSVSETLKARVLGQQVEYGGTAFDPVSRTWLGRFDLYFRLANEDADLVTPEQRLPPKLPPGWDRDRGAISMDLAPSCRVSVLRARKEIDDLVRRVTHALPLRNAFEQSSPNPDLGRELADRLRPQLSPGGQRLPIEIECRGRICALRARAGDPDAEVRWNCPKDSKSDRMCWASGEGDWWFSRLARMSQRGDLLFLDRIEGPWKRNGEEGPALVSVRPTQEQAGVSGQKWILELARKLDFTGMVAGCEKRNPAKGILTVFAKVPDTCGQEDDLGRPRVTVEYGGELFGSELWACMKTATEQALSRVEPPACTYGWVGEWRLEFPHPKIQIPGSGN